MKIVLAAVGTRMPDWVSRGYTEYAARLPHECRLELREAPMARRGKNADLARLKREEADRLRASVPAGAHVVALEVGGKPWSTGDLATRLSGWLGSGRDVALLVGGPDGLDPELSASATERWSLSPLTLPHPLVRVILAEQIYRAWTVKAGHPYPRGN